MFRFLFAAWFDGGFGSDFVDRRTFDQWTGFGWTAKSWSFSCDYVIVGDVGWFGIVPGVELQAVPPVLVGPCLDLYGGIPDSFVDQEGAMISWL